MKLLAWFQNLYVVVAMLIFKAYSKFKGHFDSKVIQ